MFKSSAELPKRLNLSDEMAIHVEMMDENYLTAEILGISLADGKQISYLSRLKLQKNRPHSKNWLQNTDKLKYSSDSKAACASLCASRSGCRTASNLIYCLRLILSNPSTTYTDVASVTRGVRLYRSQSRMK